MFDATCESFIVAMQQHHDDKDKQQLLASWENYKEQGVQVLAVV